MAWVHSYLNSAAQISDEYHGKELLASFVKKSLGPYKKFGSPDRNRLTIIQSRPGKDLDGTTIFLNLGPIN